MKSALTAIALSIAIGYGASFFARAAADGYAAIFAPINAALTR